VVLKVLSAAKIIFLVAVTTISFVAAPCFAGEVRRHENLYDYLTIGDFDCSISSKSLLKPGQASGTETILGNDPVCFYNVACSPKKGVTGAKNQREQLECPAPKGVCQDLVECAKEDRVPSKQSEITPEWTVFKVTGKPSGTAKCSLDQDDPSEMAVYQFYNEGKVAEQVCIGTYACKGDPVVRNAACRPSNNASGKAIQECPQIDACLSPNHKVEMPEAMTELELKRIAAINPGREKALRVELSKPAVVASALPKPPGNAVSSTSFQPRTANIIGSRTSVSNPPASTPPASSGHTGRGMK
jgi:hypothetical protein